MKRLFLGAILLVVGCFDASVVSKLQLKCSKELPGCQPGFFCYIPKDSINNEGACVNTLQLTDPTYDFSGGTVVTDLASTDMSMVDMRIPLDFSIPPSTCKAGGGTSLGDGSFACIGTWSFNASSLCTTKVCPSISTLAKSNCDALNGFYFGNVGGGLDYATSSVFECATNVSNQAPIFYGCGKGGLVSNINCKGFNGYLKCVPGSNFTCVVDISNIDNSVSKGPQMGVVCCP